MFDQLRDSIVILSPLSARRAEVSDFVEIFLFSVFPSKILLISTFASTVWEMIC
jgi:hypothetical protein